MGLLSQLASRPEVLHVEPLPKAEVHNAVAGAIVQSATVTGTPLHDAGLDGTGEVIQVQGGGGSLVLRCGNIVLCFHRQHTIFPARSFVQARPQRAGTTMYKCTLVSSASCDVFCSVPFLVNLACLKANSAPL